MPIKEIEAYLEKVPEPFNAALRHLHATVRGAAPDAEEAIAYGIPTFRHGGNLVHYAAFKNHMSFFPGGTAHNEAFRERLAGYKLSQGTIQFTIDNPLPDDLVAEIVRFRIAENEEQARTRKK